MRPRLLLRASLIGGLLIGAIYAHLPFREYPGVEYENFPLPRDYKDPGEWAFARLMYPPVPSYYGGFQFFGDWRLGGSNWTMDYPRSDRHFAAAIRRLTRLHARSVEQPVNLDDGDDVFDWPWLYGVEVGHWNLTDTQAQKLREYLLRGGFNDPLMLYFTESDVGRLLPMPEAIRLMREAFVKLAGGGAQNHPRRRLVLPTSAVLHYMPAAALPERLS